jgi:hypothetical protein
MQPALLSKTFKFQRHDPSKGAVVHGSIHVDEDGLYLVYRKHTWESANTAAATFGLLGMLIHHLFTKKKPFELPTATLPIEQLSQEIKDALDLKKAPTTATVSVVPKADVLGYKKSMFTGCVFTLADYDIVAMSPKGKVAKQLPELGYKEVQ